jgi:hypothetical protein
MRGEEVYETSRHRRLEGALRKKEVYEGGEEWIGQGS